MARKGLLGGGIEEFSTYRELFWYLTNCTKRIIWPPNLLNLLLQRIEFTARKTKLSSYPAIIQMEGTNLCNLNCPMCFRKLQGREFGEMSAESARHYIDGMPRLLWVSLGGWGEPFMCHDLFQIIEYANSKGIGVGLISNGTLLTSDDFINKIFSRKAFRMGVSIDTTVPDKIRDYKDFEVVKEGITRITKRFEEGGKRAPMRLIMTIMNKNVDDLGGILKFAKETGIRHVHLHGVGAFDYSSISSNYILPEREVLLKSIKPYEETAKEMGIKLTNNAIFEGPKKICRLPWTTPFITWQGTVHPCCSYLEKTFGNLNEHDLKTIWNNKEYQEFRKNMASKNFDKICQERCRLKAE